ncbi:MAG: diadenylate cyclase CdaA, partial [Spirochaetota bacterium]|nr:diadenylate cyclase CdaA [Spirochaetota bacterium]
MSISIVDIIDILIVGYLIYKLLSIIAGTRAIQTLKGIIIIVFVYFIAYTIKLSTFLWLFERLEIIVIALIVIFQHELRRIVMKLGERTPFIGKILNQAENDIISILSQAVYSLSDKKMGALIVIVRKTGLRGIIEQGIELDAIITKELIESIFVPKNPLHDGAVIIVENRIAAAACLLPLTQRMDLEKVFGTRHRAAIGLSEETDSIIITVSEENGYVSIAHEAKLHYGLKKEKFETMLNNLLSNTSNESMTSYTYWVHQQIHNTKVRANEFKTKVKAYRNK